MFRNVMALVIVGMCIAPVSMGAGEAQEGTQEPKETTIAGCLQAGPNEGEFVLVNDEKTTYQVQAVDSVEVAPHVNHRVELTGTVEMTESSLIIKATALKMVSTACSQ